MTDLPTDAKCAVTLEAARYLVFVAVLDCVPCQNGLKGVIGLMCELAVEVKKWEVREAEN
jgi:hypothetical protein